MSSVVKHAPERVQQMIDTNLAALLVVDVQNDFCSGGALPVPDAERVVSVVNRHLDFAAAHGVIVYASRDWHPAFTRHFKAYGGPVVFHNSGDVFPVRL